jgi:hypothetical protein
LENFIQTGSGISHFEGLPPYQHGYGFFVSAPRYRGNGVGDIFRSIWRVLKPMATAVGQAVTPVAKTVGSAIGEEGLATGARVLSDIVQGKNAKESLINEGREGARRLFERASQNLQRGSGAKRRRNTGGRVVLKPDDYVGRSVSRRGAINKSSGIRRKQRFDSLGFY